MLHLMLPRKRLCVIFKFEKRDGAVVGLPHTVRRPSARKGDLDQGAAHDAVRKPLKRIAFALNLDSRVLIVRVMDPMQRLLKRHSKLVGDDHRRREQSIFEDVF